MKHLTTQQQNRPNREPSRVGTKRIASNRIESQTNHAKQAKQTKQAEGNASENRRKAVE